MGLGAVAPQYSGGGDRWISVKYKASQSYIQNYKKVNFIFGIGSQVVWLAWNFICS